LADAQSLGGQFRAILSTAAMPAAARLVVAGPVHNMMNEVVADDADDLRDGSLLAPDGNDELGNQFFGNVWSGTTQAGEVAADNCDEWTISSGGVLGRIGRPEASDATWIDFNNGVCTLATPVYCLEQ
jgi:hypothetical protein